MNIDPFTLRSYAQERVRELAAPSARTHQGQRPPARRLDEMMAHLRALADLWAEAIRPQQPVPAPVRASRFLTGRAAARRRTSSL